MTNVSSTNNLTYCTYTENMDTEGAKAVVKEIILNKNLKFDVTYQLSDCDASVTKVTSAMKEELLGNPGVVQAYPHLSDYTPTIEADYCLGHIIKHMVEQVDKIVDKWKDKYHNGKKMPRNCSKSKLKSYIAVVFRDGLTKYRSYNDRKKFIKQVISHLDEKSKHNTQLCRDRGCYKKQTDPTHLKLPNTLTKMLNKDFIAYIDNTLLKNMSMMATTNRCESANKSITKYLPKNIFHPGIRVIDCLSQCFTICKYSYSIMCLTNVH